MSCNKIVWPKIEPDQPHGDYWWKRAKRLEELLHQREQYMREVFMMFHNLESQHAIQRDKKGWVCLNKACGIEFKETPIEQLVLIFALEGF